jgi:hypothetical protein
MIGQPTLEFVQPQAPWQAPWLGRVSSKKVGHVAYFQVQETDEVEVEVEVEDKAGRRSLEVCVFVLSVNSSLVSWI